MRVKILLCALVVSFLLFRCDWGSSSPALDGNQNIESGLEVRKLTTTVEKFDRSLFSRFVAIGDSLTHGCLSLTVDERRQQHTWAALVAKQMGTEFNQPTLKFPGFMINMEDIGKGTIKWYEYFYPLAGGVRCDNYRDQSELNNFGISSATLDQVMTGMVKTNNVFFNNLLGTVLPYHHLVVGYSGVSAVDQALARDPSFLSVWIGNNDTLIAAVIMMDMAVTPADVYKEYWGKLIAKIHAKKSIKGVVMGNIPNLMDIALFEPLPDGSYKSLWQPDFDDIGEIMSKKEADTIMSRIRYCNELIEDTAIANGWAFTDANQQFSEIKRLGQYELKTNRTYLDKNGMVQRMGSGRIIGSDYLEGLFSLDGIHPSMTGYAIIANSMIQSINDRYGSNMQYIDEYDVSEKDSLYKEPFDPRTWMNSWVFKVAYNVYKIIL